MKVVVVVAMAETATEEVTVRIMHRLNTTRGW